MPWIRRGTKIYKKVGDRYIIKQRCRSIKNAQAALRLLRGLESKEK